MKERENGVIENLGHTDKLYEIARQLLLDYGYKPEDIVLEYRMSELGNVRADMAGKNDSLGLTLIEIGNTQPEKLVLYKAFAKNVWHLPSEQFYDYFLIGNEDNHKTYSKQLGEFNNTISELKQEKEKVERDIRQLKKEKGCIEYIYDRLIKTIIRLEDSFKWIRKEYEEYNQQTNRIKNVREERGCDETSYSDYNTYKCDSNKTVLYRNKDGKDDTSSIEAETFAEIRKEELCKKLRELNEKESKKEV